MTHVEADLEAAQAMGANPNGSGAARPKYILEPFGTIALPEGPLAIIDDIIPRHSLVVPYGESGCGKSFLMTAMGLAIATGCDWAGKAVTKGSVVYVSAEGASGFRRRIVAAREHFDIPSDVPFYLIAAAPDLGHTDGDAAVLIACIRAQVTGPVDLVVIDTLARTMQGADENSAADMSAFVDCCGKIASELNCSVAVVHHSGKTAAAGARGSSVLRAAADVEIFIEKTESGRTATVTKAKDGESGLTLAFDLEPVDLADGTSSCVVRIVEPWKSATPARKAVRQPTGQRKHLLQIIRNCLAEHGEPAPSSTDYPPGRVVSRERVRAEAVAAQFGGADCQSNVFRAQLSRALSQLTGDGFIGQRGDWIWISK